MEGEKANPRMAMMRGCAARCDGEKRRLIPLCFERASATKKMKTEDEEEEEVLLAYPSREEEDGKKRKKVVKRLGKEEVERLLSVTVTVPTLSDHDEEEEEEEEDVWVREVLLRANRSLRASAMSMRQAQDLIRSLFEAKGYVDVLDEVSDDDDEEMNMEMQPVQLHL